MSIRLVKENYNADEVAYFRATYKLTNCKFTQSILVPGCTSATEAQAKVYDSFGRDKVEWCAASPVWAKGTELQTLLDRGMPILDEAYIVKPEVDLFDDEENQKSYDYGSSDASDDWCECNDCGWFGESDELVNGEICPDCGCADIIREPMNESKKAVKESTKAGGRFTINFGHWVQAKSFPTQLDLLKFLRSHVISSSSIITLAKNVTDDYMKSTWYDTAENVQKFNLTSEQRHEIFEKGYTKINQNVSEQMQRNPEEDGWPGIVKDITDKVLSRASTIKYEIDNCVRGAYISGTTIDDLIKSLRYLKNDLIDAIDQLQADARHINESIDCETIEDIDNFISDVKSRFPGSEAIYDGDTHSIKITLDNVCESIKNNSVTESFDADYSNSEVYQASSIESLNNYAAGLGTACKDLKPGLGISVKGYYVERSDDGETYHVWNDLGESKIVKEDLNDPDEVLIFKRNVNSADNLDDIELLIMGLSDGIAEVAAQEAFDANELKSLQEVKDAVISAIDLYLEDNEWLGESLKESTLSISDLKAFYNTSDSIDKNKYPNFFAWYDDIVRTGRYKNESISTELEEWVSNSKESSKTFGAELRGSTIKLADEGEKIGNFSLYKFVNAWCLAKRRLADGKWIEVGCFDSEKKARKYADKHMNESVSIEQADCVLEENWWTVKPDWDDYCPHCCNRSLVGAGDGRAVCHSCNAEYNIEPMPNGRVKITELEESLTESKQAVKNILQPLVTNGRVRAFKSDEKRPRGFAFKSGNGSSGQVSYNGKDYVYAVVDGELRVMTDAEAGSNWSETIYAKESLTVNDTLKIERDIANLMSESGLDVDYVDCFATRSEAIKLNIKVDNIDAVEDLVKSYCENNCLTILSEYRGPFGNIVYTLSKDTNCENANNTDEVITEKVNIGDTVKVNTPGNMYYDGRTGIVDYVESNIVSVLFDDGKFPKMNNFDMNQISKIDN